MQVISDPASAVLGPRERLAMYGRAALSDSELIAVLLGTGSHAFPVGLTAERLLDHAGGLHGVARLSVAQLGAQTGIGVTKACRVLSAVELGMRVSTRPLERRRAITCSRDIDTALRPRFLHEPREHFLAVALDAKNQPVAELTIAIGGSIACAIAPADVFRPVLQAAAVSVIFVHNHPSGDPHPSEADVAITERLCHAGQVLGVAVLDHVVLGAQGYYSFADAGLLVGMSLCVPTP
ncbi:MAG TPA: DNA repair protein RadC [Polyangiales bacterium]|nr:DNA repair protein RadC [Polyangiales bacterium]